jgi:hypothetical protein
VNRREFLLFRRDREDRIVELSCRCLYMRCLDAQMTGAEPTEDGEAPDPWAHEPPAILERRTAAQIFEEIAFGLSEADVLTLVDREWIRDPAMNARLDALIADFTKHGGRLA